jgi:hypothetical protein
LHYFVIAAVAMVASSVWFGENVHSIRRLCLVIGLGCALAVVATAHVAGARRVLGELFGLLAQLHRMEKR